ncbi:ribbon-helix-helix domain-containing protein [Haloarchaeobius sp. TZWWS8]|uniref:ribbon-helix-helix domain-containing protein n=1 Tax=Haloarchaeobius sp. TZWWS8 TaxID=3446121 RepID=UPI003EBE0E1A
MQPITLRLSDSLLDNLDEEATKFGFGSRSEYVRQLLRNRSGVESNTGANTKRIQTEYVSREEFDDLVSRVDKLESGETAVDVEGPDTAEGGVLGRVSPPVSPRGLDARNPAVELLEEANSLEWDSVVAQTEERVEALAVAADLVRAWEGVGVTASQLVYVAKNGRELGINDDSLQRVLSDMLTEFEEIESTGNAYVWVGE